ncbi:HAAS signaling domain-containing protein [Bogoriella caseilytica]|uniref:Uncharacterized protein n=1 Tax=Bogoriella caseilytica TaxID=56055 RepID=A0A3N2BEY0_9MICO|nr:hypothetical protein [Bogoriella caseilytica]ROR73594.1 hypothetical protein EDD31_1981 [Bogoriella caseilytica]
MTTHPAPPTSAHEPSQRPSTLDRLRRTWYVTKVELWLDDETPRHEVKSLTEGLRGDLDAAAADSSMREAIAELGPARELARSYRQTLSRTRKPLWLTGVGMASAWLLVAMFATAFFASALWQSAGEHGRASAQLLWSEFAVVRTDTEISTSISGVHWTVLIALVVFVLGARLWRLIPALRPGTDD